MSEETTDIKVYHIIHIDRLDSILADGFLYCDAEINSRQKPGTIIGISNIKERRLTKNLASFDDLTVGQCVPFYFCPRSVMLYVIHCKNHPDLKYLNGQEDIIHLVFDLKKILEWCHSNNIRACYTTSNAGSNYFNDYSDFSEINNRIDWNAVNAFRWSGVGIDQSIKENKQAELLIENKLPITLLDGIGVYNLQNYNSVNRILNRYNNISPSVTREEEWYY